VKIIKLKTCLFVLIYNTHFMVTTDDKVCEHYYYNLIMLLFYFHAKAEAQHGR